MFTAGPYEWILILGICTIVGIWLYNRHWRPEGFQNVPTLFGATPSADQEPSALPWEQSATDRAARTGNRCTVLDSFPDPELADAVIEIVDSSCESGLPHTIGENRIIIPESAWNSSEERRQSILRHERIHLQQRRAATAWEAFYKREWEYTLHTEPPTGIAGPVDVRANPDTWPSRWACWRDRYWFIPEYAEGAPPQLSAARTRVWDAREKRWLTDGFPYAWRIQFCTEQGRCPHQSEHPAEISAEYITDIANWTTPAAMSLRRFME